MTKGFEFFLDKHAVAIWRLTTTQMNQWIIDEINKLKIALDQLELQRIKLPSCSYEEAEAFEDFENAYSE